MTEQELFTEALQIEDSQARSKWLSSVCTGEPEKLRRLEALLAAHQNPQKILAQPAIQIASSGEEGAGGSLVPAEPALPEKIGAYRLLELLGRGGMGAVYKALHTRLEKVVALKVLHPERMNNPQARARFEREMKAVGKLEHPNLVRALDAGEIHGYHFLVMEYIDGINVAHLIQKCGPLSLANGCEIVRQTALGLQEVHKHGMVHRDVKPSNLILDRAGNIKVFDLGLALLQNIQEPRNSELTSTNQVMGTLDYMSPEQCMDSHDVDIRSDIYSLGATFYHLITAQTPFPSDTYPTVGKIIYAKINQPSPSIHSQCGDIPETITDLLDRLLDREPKNRPATPGEVAAALTPFCKDHDLLKLKGTASSRSMETANALAVSAETVESVSHHPEEAEKPLAKGEIVPEALTETAIQARPASPGARRVVSPARVIVLLALIALGTAGWLFGGTVFRFATNKGVLIIEVNDPSIEVAVKMNGVVVRDKTNEREFTLDAKEGEIEVYEKDGIGPVLTKKFQLNRGGKTTVVVTLKELADAKDPRPGPGPGADVVKKETWSRGPTDNVLNGILPAPRLFKNLGRWQISTIDGSPGPAKWNPDGRLVAVPIAGMIEVINADKQQRVFALGRGNFAWSPNGQWLAHLNQDGRILQFFDKEGKPGTFPDKKSFIRTSAPVRSMVWSPGSDAIALLGKTALLVSPNKGKVGELKGKGEFRDIRWTDDAKHLVSCNASNPEIHRWDRSGKVLESIDHPEGVNRIELHPDGKHVLAVSGDLRFLVTLRCKPLLKEPLLKVSHFAWSPDQKTLAIAMGGEIRLMDQKLTLKKTLKVSKTQVHYFVWRPDGTGLLSMSRDRTARYITVENGKVVPLNVRVDWSKVDHLKLYLGWNHNGTHAAVALHGEGLWKLDGQKPIKQNLRMLPGYATHYLAWSPNSNRFVVSRVTLGTLQMYDANGKAIGSLTAERPRLFSAQASPKSDQVAALVDGKTLQLFSMKGAVKKIIPIREGARFFEWHPDGIHVLYGTQDKQWVKVLNINTGKIVAQTEGGDTKRISAAFEPTKGEVIAILSPRDCSLWRWKVERAPQKKIPRSNEGIQWSPDGKAILFLGEFGTPTLCDTDGKVLAKYEAAKQSAGCAWSKKGNYLVFHPSRFQPKKTVFSRDGTLKASLNRSPVVGISPDGKEVSAKWTLDGELRQPYEANQYVQGQQTSDGEHLISGGGNRIRIWSTNSRKLQAIILLLPGSESVVLSAAGELLFATPDAIEQLVYIVEEANGTLAPLSASEFYKRVGEALIKPTEVEIPKETGKAPPAVKEDLHARSRKAAEWALSWGAHIRIKGEERYRPDIPSEPFILVGIRHGTGLTRRVNTRDIAAINGLSSLENLDMCAGMTDSALAQLDNLPGLRQLRLSHYEGAGITDACIPYLSRFPSLESLSLVRSRITANGIQKLASLPEMHNLKELRLHGLVVSDEVLKPLENLTHLEALHLGEGRFTKEGLKYLSDLPLKELILYRSTADDSCAPALLAIKTLEHLCVRETRMTFQALERLAVLPHLRNLDTRGLTLSSKEIEQLNKMCTRNAEKK